MRALARTAQDLTLSFVLSFVDARHVARYIL